MRRFATAFLLLSVICLSYSLAAASQWQQNGVPVSLATAIQDEARVVSDGNGGAFIVWEDTRNNLDVYAQHVDAWGNALWTTDGVRLSPVAANQFDPAAVSDGAGGVIIAWEDAAGGQPIVAQRLDADGNLLWGANGTVVSTAASGPARISLVADGQGGAVVCWNEFRNGNWDIFGQHLDSSGTPTWGGADVVVCDDPGFQDVFEMTTDDAGGAILAWEDTRNGQGDDVYAQRLDATGTRVWSPANGVDVATEVNNQSAPQVAPDGQGGVIIVWQDQRAGTFAIYGQRINDQGAAEWLGADGMAINNLTDVKTNIDVVSDGALGAILSWRDTREPNGDIYAQRVTATGSFLWTVQGELVCSSLYNQNSPVLVADGNGGAVIAWRDNRNLASTDIYAQRMDGSGSPVWTANGIPLSTAAGDENLPVIASDGAGGALVVTQRNPGNEDLWAQRVERNGYWGYPSACAVSADDIPGDEGGLVNLTWDASRLDPWPELQIQDYTVWRALTLPSVSAMMSSGVPVIDDPSEARKQSSRVIRREMTASGASYWELIGTVAAYGLNAYSMTAPTTNDSISGNDGMHYFQIIAHSASNFWISNTVSGYSVDNLAPGAPLALSAQRVSNDVQLTWDPSGFEEADFSHYAVYRSETPGVMADPGMFLSDAPDTTLLDTSADPGTMYYYIVTAKDIHENESDPSNEANVPVVVGIGDQPPSFSALTVFGNTPNPFGVDGTVIRFGLPSASDVVVEVFDVAGRRVAVERVSRRGAGLGELRFAGRDASGQLLPSGVYFYRVAASGQSQVRKMVILR